ncbi:MAG: hypothetical protein EXR54_01155 [Dehalococcoidia bacterium]|nr:hypothetical protein [Dehalococcoidia bacterium]MSQ16166.1 hypothetical protein [Dehalococcoidia bacterium]
MTKLVRYGLILVSSVQVCLAVAFFLRLPFAVDLWPFAGTTPLTFMFIASILAAAASTLWVAWSEHYGALAGIGIDYVAILGPAAIYSAQLGGNGGDPHLIAYGIVCVLGAIFGIGLILWSRRFPLEQTPAMPGVVRWSFVGFVVALVIVGTLLIFRVPNIIPWKITPELSVAIGMFFAGAATYFAYGALRPSWANAAGQLAGFLAYDLVLIVPFLKRLPTVPPEQRASLYVYTAVLIYSGLLAIYYLFINKATRLWSRTPSEPAKPQPK